MGQETSVVEHTSEVLDRVCVWCVEIQGSSTCAMDPISQAAPYVPPSTRQTDLDQSANSVMELILGLPMMGRPYPDVSAAIVLARYKLIQ
jgi:hypothetical protein